jgi:hypothetical protein
MAVSTWWIDEPVLMGAAIRATRRSPGSAPAGSRSLVCLLDETEQRPRYDLDAAGRAGWSRHAIPVRDYTAPSIEQISAFVDLVGAAGDAIRTLVHCEGAMAAAYWIARGLSAPDAIARVRRARPGAIESDEQHHVLHEFAQRRHADDNARQG